MAAEDDLLSPAVPGYAIGKQNSVHKQDPVWTHVSAYCCRWLSEAGHTPTPPGYVKAVLLNEMIQPLVSIYSRVSQSYANLIEALSCKTLQLQHKSNSLSPEKQQILYA